MKKKLEADLISIAHRILKLKNRYELIQLHQETQKLYEKLSVLCFVEENFGEVKPTIGLYAMQEKIEEIFDAADKKEIQFFEEKVITKAESNDTEERIAEVVAPVELQEEEKLTEKEIVFEEVLFKPNFEFITPVEEEKKLLTLETLLESVAPDPVFVRLEDIPKKEEITKSTSGKDLKELIKNKLEVEKIESKETESEKIAKQRTLNDRLKKGISFGLNDRIAFEKHLFGNSGEDLNRVISQLNTFDNYDDAKNFIEDLVRPDYNNWQGEDDYVTRFMEIVENKFI